MVFSIIEPSLSIFCILARLIAIRKALICPNCSSADFYSDPITGALICSSCYTQSQTATQEELEYEDSIGLAATGRDAKRIYTHGRVGSNLRDRKRPLSDYDRSKALPDVEDCCLAFQWLLWDASKCVAKLAGIHDEEPRDSCYDDDEEEEARPISMMERTVERIWFAYLKAWMDATAEYAKRYPEMRVSFRDLFLDDQRKRCVMRHLSVTVGRKVEEEMIQEIIMKMKNGGEKSHEDDEKDDNSIPSTECVSASIHGDSGDRKRNIDDADDADDASNKPTPKMKKRKRQLFLTVAQLRKNGLQAKMKRHPNGLFICPKYHAAIKIAPSMTLLLAILQLALMHLKSGVAPHHLTAWVASGQLPHALNGYTLLPSRLKEKLDLVRPFFLRSFVPPAEMVANLTCMLAAACSWYGGDVPLEKPRMGRPRKNPTLEVEGAPHVTSLYNIPLLAARMILDFGFDRAVSENTMALIGVKNSLHCGTADALGNDDENECDSKSSKASDRSTKIGNDPTLSPAPLKCALPERLYSPLHVAAVIVIACKLCPGWETWEITNLNAAGNSATQNRAFVPWNESQLQLLGTGPTLNHYVEFLQDTAFSSLVPTKKGTTVAQFFQSFERELNDQSSFNNEDSVFTKSIGHAVKAAVMPNTILSGATNPNEPNPTSHPAEHDQYLAANNLGRYISYLNDESCAQQFFHPHYCRLLEYICYIIEETDTMKLHNIVEEFEKELLGSI